MIGDTIKKERIKKGITQNELAKIIGVSPSAIGMYEQNRRQPDSESLLKIASYFQVTVDYLLGVSDNTSKKQSTYTVPECFTNTDQAREYINKHQIFGSQGFDASKLDDEEIIQFANELLQQMKMVSWKYRK